MTNYQTLDETKTLIGISGTSKDSLINILLPMASENLEALLNVTDLAVHNVVDERVVTKLENFLMLRDFPFNSLTSMTDVLLNAAITGFTAEPEGGKSRRVFFVDDNGLPQQLTSNKIKISYNAGYSKPTFTVTTFGNLLLKTITYAGVTLTEGTDFDAETDNDTTAANIAAAFGSDIASAASGVVTFEGFGTVSTNAVSGFTITATAFPQELRAVVAYIIAGMIAERDQAGGVSSYRLGEKSVTFRNNGDKNTSQQILLKYSGSYQYTKVTSI